MLDGVGLVHMNGRVYDQNLGRFLSVDPVFQAPHNGQSLNPYSYVLNNPLSLVDPSGYASDCASNNSCPDNNDTTGSANQINGRAEKVAPTGSHINSSVRISAIVGGKRVDITIDSNNHVVAASGVYLANGATHSQAAGDAIRNSQTSDTATSNQTAGQAAMGNASSSISAGCGQVACASDDLLSVSPYTDPKSLHVSDDQIATTEANETLSQNAYPDPKGSTINSIGYGFRLDSVQKIQDYVWNSSAEDGSVDKNEADTLTRHFERSYVEGYLDRRLKGAVTQGQYNAMSDYVYQHGHLPGSVLGNIRSGNYVQAAFGLYDSAYPNRSAANVNEFLRATPGFYPGGQ